MTIKVGECMSRRVLISQGQTQNEIQPCLFDGDEALPRDLDSTVRLREESTIWESWEPPRIFMLGGTLFLPSILANFPLKHVLSVLCELRLSLCEPHKAALPDVDTLLLPGLKHRCYTRPRQAFSFSALHWHWPYTELWRTTTNL